MKGRLIGESWWWLKLEKSQEKIWLRVVREIRRGSRKASLEELYHQSCGEMSSRPRRRSG